MAAAAARKTRSAHVDLWGFNMRTHILMWRKSRTLHSGQPARLIFLFFAAAGSSAGVLFAYLLNRNLAVARAFIVLIIYRAPDLARPAWDFCKCDVLFFRPDKVCAWKHIIAFDKKHNGVIISAHALYYFKI